MIIKNIKFVSFEFDFGYFEEDENSAENFGNISAEAFVEVDNNGEMSTMKYQAELRDIDFSDFITEEEKSNILSNLTNLNDYIQALRKLITFKIASDLGAEVAELNYVPSPPIKSRVDTNEQAILELSILMAGGDA